ncbi:MAG: bifunctional folylpolyglutamate synthase/dihydrofolate synthase [Acutalibacteraceae bacterium]
MNYEEAVSYIYSRQKFAKSSFLERIDALLEKLGSPHKKLRFVHVVGTNGKGSVSKAVSSISTEAGIKTGLFTSPFVTEFRERIQIDGEYIPKETFADIVLLVKEKIEEIEKDGFYPTFFETVLACALYYFYKCGCGLAVLEAGIGGKDDSTNIIPTPEAVVFTSVSFDHTEVLGNTLSEIAKAKCGVIKNGCEVISFPKENAGFDFVPQQTEVCSIIESVCKEKNCPLVYPDMSLLKNVSRSIEGTDFELSGEKYHIPLIGDHQLANAMCALACARILQKKGFTISDADIKSGLEKAFMPARMEIISKNPLVIIDGGHNAGCMTALSKMIQNHLKGKRITAVLAFMKDKDHKTAIDIIAPLCDSIVFTLAENGRGEDPQTLMEEANTLCKNVFCTENCEEAFEKAKELCSHNGAIICAGSFYLVSQIRKNLIG